MDKKDIPLGLLGTTVLNKICHALSEKGRKKLLEKVNAERIAKGLEELQGKIWRGKRRTLKVTDIPLIQTPKGEVEVFEGYHLKKFVDVKAPIRRRSSPKPSRNKFSDLIKESGAAVGYSTIEDLASAKGTSEQLTKAIFQALADLQEDTPLVECLVQFLEFCLNNHRPIRGYDELTLKTAINEIRSHIENCKLTKGNTTVITKSEIIDSLLKEPLYVPESRENGEVSLNPFDHYSIDLLGRKSQLSKLNCFLNEGDQHFSILPIIGPSGSGKTRLASEWLHKQVDSNLWQAGFVQSNNHELWKKWKPKCDTLIIVDYIYRFKDVISEVVQIGECEKNHKVRLVVLDHIFPDNLDDMVRDHFGSSFAEDRAQLDVRKLFFQKPIVLEELENRVETIQSIIAKVSKYDFDSEEVRGAVQVLTNMNSVQSYKGLYSQPAAHPLFAILIGNALKQGLTTSSWKRHDLIDYFLNTFKRIPWRMQSYSGRSDPHGKWVASLVATATVRRGVNYNEIISSIPRIRGYKNEDIKKIKSWCQRIVSSSDNETLPPFMPDILGESFFLLFLSNYRNHSYVLKAFIDMVCVTSIEGNAESDAQKEKDHTEKYIEFVYRLSINLMNDDQESHYVKNSWLALGTFLNPKIYPENSPIVKVLPTLIVEILHITNSPLVTSILGDKIDENLLTTAPPSIVNRSDRIDLIFKYFNQADDQKRGNCFFQENLFSHFENSSYKIDENTGPLAYASRRNLLSAMKYLIKNSIYTKKELAKAMLGTCFHDDTYAASLIFDLCERNLKLSEYHGCILQACSLNNEHIVDFLLKRGVAVDFSGNTGLTALMVACIDGLHSMACKLIDNGADINVTQHLPPKHENTILDTDMSDGYHRKCYEKPRKLFNKRGLKSYDSRIKYVGSPLMYASANGHKTIVSLLLEKQAEINKEFGTSRGTALLVASHNGHQDIVFLLLKQGANVDQGDVDGVTPLIRASCHGYPNIIKELLAFKADINATDSQEVTSLIAACKMGEEEAVNLLLEYKAKTELYDSKHLSALDHACIRGYSSIVKLLLESGAKIQDCSEITRSALMHACINGHYSVVELLIEHGANVNFVLPSGWTPIFYAVINEQVDIVRLLLISGADKHHLDNNNRKVMDIAKSYHFQNIVSVLEENTDTEKNTN